MYFFVEIVKVILVFSRFFHSLSLSNLPFYKCFDVCVRVHKLHVVAVSESFSIYCFVSVFEPHRHLFD